MSAKLQMRGVSRTFVSGSPARQEDVAALSDVDLEVQEGEFVSIVGPSGCGKSTLLGLLAGFERPDFGTVLCDGVPVTGPGPERLVLFQDPGLFPWLTVLKNVEFGLRLRGVSAPERQRRAQDYLERVHLSRFAHSYPGQLSGGMKQRVAIARALVVEPQILFLDEPFSALDPRTRDLLNEELQSLWMSTRKTIVLVTHSFQEAVQLSNRVYLMRSDPGTVQRVVEVPIPHPRDFRDPRLFEIRSALLSEINTHEKEVHHEGGILAERGAGVGGAGRVLA